uniref:Thioredoxin domain-containing protein n=1 Tax=Noctiluca scintillans TaxID=2966 RepID=A0A7S1AT84_NOCSC
MRRLHASTLGFAVFLLISICQSQFVTHDCCAFERCADEKDGSALEELLAEESCPVLAALFPASSPLAQSDVVTSMEHQLAVSFPSLRYVKVDADQLGVRAFLQWDVSFLPAYMLFMPRVPGQNRRWHRWPSDGHSSPYDFDAVSAFISRTARLQAANTSWLGAGDCLRRPRGDESWSNFQLWVGWFLVAFTALVRWWRVS